MLGVFLMQRGMRERYPGSRGCTWKALGHLSTMLNARQLDLSLLFDTHPRGAGA